MKRESLRSNSIFRGITGIFLMLEAVLLALQIDRAPGRERYFLAAFAFVFFALGLYRVWKISVIIHTEL